MSLYFVAIVVLLANLFLSCGILKGLCCDYTVELCFRLSRVIQQINGYSFCWQLTLKFLWLFDLVLALILYHLFLGLHDSVCQKRFIDLCNISDSLLKKFVEIVLLLDFPLMSTQPSVVNKATGSLVFLTRLSVYKCKCGSSAPIKIEIFLSFNCSNFVF